MDGCGMKQPKIMKKSLGIMVELPDEESVKFLQLQQKSLTDRKFSLSPDDALKIVSKISEAD